ncbi:MAG: glycoside hydrolase family 57 protein [Bacteriovoracaceae bacterium]|nr:glycoside hydrolase family 57 protein [Bacteriovoracaceae bacterium]
MPTSVCFYFQVHQPFRLRKDYNFFCIGRDHFYEDADTNRLIMRRIAQHCYLPTNAMLLNLIKQYPGKFKVAFSISGTALEQFELYAPEVLQSFKDLAATGQVEFLTETYYHSLAILKSKTEFTEQIRIHQQKIKQLFGQLPTTFRNTELVYNNFTAHTVEELGLKAILAEGTEQVLSWRSPNYVYRPYTCQNLKVLFKNYKLSDDIAFRFGNKAWNEWPLTADKYVSWLDAIYQCHGETINLFLDYETFGEHQKRESGIFDFMAQLPGKILASGKYIFQTPAEVAATHDAKDIVDVHNFISWADTNRDLSAWVGNPLQDAALDLAYSMEGMVLETQDPQLIHTWRKLLTSDHLYYICTKWSSDGDVHNYFNPFHSPHDAFMAYANVLSDFKQTVEQRLSERPKISAASTVAAPLPPKTRRPRRKPRTV